MSKQRLEAFSDGVIAIVITVMVFNVKSPDGSDFTAFLMVLPSILSYTMSFLYLGVYWNNHHHLLYAAERVSGLVLWANLHLLFWLSLFPFATNWMYSSSFAPFPTAAYGLILLLAAISYVLLQTTIIRANGANSQIRTAIGRDLKGKTSLACYALGVGTSFYFPQCGLAIYIMIAILWLIPDRRIEVMFSDGSNPDNRG